MGGHHGPKLPEIPDWRIYRVEDVPELVRVQKALAQHGLTDPWLRNEVWRYTEFSQKESRFQRFVRIMSKGFKYGLVAAVLTAGAEYAFFPLRKPYGEEVGGHH